MARFLAEVEGSGQPTHRLGSPNSGIRAQAQGWDLGVKVYGHVTEDDADEFHVYITSGSNGHTSDKFIGTVRAGEFVPAEVRS